MSATIFKTLSDAFQGAVGPKQTIYRGYLARDENAFAPQFPPESIDLTQIYKNQQRGMLVDVGAVNSPCVAQLVWAAGTPNMAYIVAASRFAAELILDPTFRKDMENKPGSAIPALSTREVLNSDIYVYIENPYMSEDLKNRIYPYNYVSKLGKKENRPPNKFGNYILLPRAYQQPWKSELLNPEAFSRFSQLMGTDRTMRDVKYVYLRGLAFQAGIDEDALIELTKNDEASMYALANLLFVKALRRFKDGKITLDPSRLKDLLARGINVGLGSFQAIISEDDFTVPLEGNKPVYKPIAMPPLDPELEAEKIELLKAIELKTKEGATRQNSEGRSNHSERK